MSLTEPLIQAVDVPEVPFEEREITIDEFLDSHYQVSRLKLNYVHFVFSHFRKPAVEKIAHERFMRQFKLFVDYEGKTWRVTGGSRLGDIWLTSNFEQDHGYERRVMLVLNRFDNWRSEADFPLSWRQRWMMGVGFYGVQGQHDCAPGKASRHVKVLDDAKVPSTFLGLGTDARAYLLHNLPPPGLYV